MEIHYSISFGLQAVGYGDSHIPTTAFLINSLPLPVPLDKVLPSPLDSIVSLLDPLKRLLRTLGISVEHLVEGLRKCVDELGPEASESVKKLLEALSYLV
ncbi:PREDICTED: secretoglobin family 3A member 2 [Propithecus coquereli]|uniref:Secretoglobin family 3A member 2 n=1 Tax=Propithecus coquereli TaxID=379532 RepID=A0A2K6GSV6_PROCO|nr:PREDICTED: secretoglobin family 3A member 2 [Propithecus coquereli]